MSKKLLSVVLILILILSSFGAVFADECTVSNSEGYTLENEIQIPVSELQSNKCLNSSADLVIPTESSTQAQGLMEASASSTIHIDYSLSVTRKIVRGTFSWSGGDLTLGRVDVSMELLHANTRDGKYTSEDTSSVDNAAKGASYSDCSANVSTGYWKFVVETKVYNTEGTSKSYSNNEIRLFNDAGIEYPSYTDSKSGIEMTEPSASWSKVSSPVKALTTTQRDAYKAWYEKKYNKGKKIDWSNIEIHHIRPRIYGGTNDYSNLIPLKYSFHRQTVNSWWANYKGTNDSSIDVD